MSCHYTFHSYFLFKLHTYCQDYPKAHVLLETTHTAWNQSRTTRGKTQATDLVIVIKRSCLTSLLRSVVSSHLHDGTPFKPQLLTWQPLMWLEQSQGVSLNERCRFKSCLPIPTRMKKRSKPIWSWCAKILGISEMNHMGFSHTTMHNVSSQWVSVLWGKLLLMPQV